MYCTVVQVSIFYTVSVRHFISLSFSFIDFCCVVSIDNPITLLNNPYTVAWVVVLYEHCVEWELSFCRNNLNKMVRVGVLEEHRERCSKTIFFKKNCYSWRLLWILLWQFALLRNPEHIKWWELALFRNTVEMWTSWRFVGALWRVWSTVRVGVSYERSVSISVRVGVL